MWANRQRVTSFFGLLLLITTVTGWASAQEKCGYLDKARKLVIPAQFESASRFSEGLAAVCVAMQ